MYLGHKIDAEGVHPAQDKVKAIQEAPAPRNINELNKSILLGLLNYYQKFLPKHQYQPIKFILGHIETQCYP